MSQQERVFKTQPRKANRHSNTYQNGSNHEITPTKNIHPKSSSSSLGSIGGGGVSEKEKNDDDLDDLINQSSHASTNNEEKDIFQIIEEDRIKSLHHQQLDPESKERSTSKKEPSLQIFKQNNATEEQNSSLYAHTEEEEDDTPIIYTNKNDDDNVSQITSSITGNSVYSHDIFFQSSNTHGKNKDSKRQSKHKSSFLRNLDSVDRNGSNDIIDMSLLQIKEEDKDHQTKSTNSTNSRGTFNYNAKNKKILHATDNLNNKTDSIHDEFIDDDVVNIYPNKYLSNNSNRDFHNVDLNNNFDEEEGKDQHSIDLTLKDMYSLSDREENHTDQSLAEIPSWLQDDCDDEISEFQNSFVSGRKKSTNVQNYFSSFDMKDWSFQNLKSTMKSLSSRLMNKFRASNFLHKKNDDLILDTDSLNGYTHFQDDATDYMSILMSSSTVMEGGNLSFAARRKYRQRKMLLEKLRLLLILFAISIILFLAKTGNDAAIEKRRSHSNEILQPHDSNLISNEQNTLPFQSDRNIKSAPTTQDHVHVRTIMKENDPNIIMATNVKNDIMKTSPLLLESQINGMELPPVFNGYADVYDLPFDRSVQTPHFWHVPRSGGSTMNDILGQCFHYVIASNAGIMGDHGKDASLQVVKFGQVQYVNVDVSNMMGIERAAHLGLAPSGLADVIINPLLHESAVMFDTLHKGRLFTMMRHPVDRAVSLFHYLQDTQWRVPNTFNERLANISMHDFIKSGLAESNWQVRYLTNQVTKGILDDNDLNLAKEILRRKFLIGLFSEKGESMVRFQKYFGWSLKNTSDQACYEHILNEEWPLQHKHERIEENTPLWTEIEAHNIYDMQLYEYAKFLYHQQKALFN